MIYKELLARLRWRCIKSLGIHRTLTFGIMAFVDIVNLNIESMYLRLKLKSFLIYLIALQSLMEDLLRIDVNGRVYFCL